MQISCSFENHKKKYREVSMSMAYSEVSSRSTLKINEDLMMGIGTELVYLVPSSLSFQHNYKNLSEFEDRAITDKTTNKVSMIVPLDTSLKIYAYRFTENYSLADLNTEPRTPISLGESSSFSVSESTSSLTIKLVITPIGIPGFFISDRSSDNITQGESVIFTVKLNTHPKETVTVPVAIDNTSIASLSLNTLTYTPINWATPQTVILTSDNNSNYSDNITLKTTLGTSSSEDSDYNGLSSSFSIISISHKWLLIAKQIGISDSDPLFSSNARSSYLQNDNDSSQSIFMSIGNLDKTKYSLNGKYNFKLIWGGKEVDSSGINKEVYWTQTSWLTESTITGFSEIGTSGYVTNNYGQGFFGLGKSTSNNCVLDGDGSTHKNWWNCVGVVKRYHKTIPGPLGKKASSMYLYIRTP